MKKIMFNDRYGLARAVLEGRKTMTRRIIPLCDHSLDFLKVSDYESDRGEYLFSSKTALDGAFPSYKVGEELAVAQSYSSIEREIEKEGLPLNIKGEFRKHKGWTNKMFVRADLMPHRIRITNIRVERLQDISDEDCLKEGIYERKDVITPGMECVVRYAFDGTPHVFRFPREAFAYLIDKVSGKGTWDRNPWVFAYEFELVR